MNDVPWSRDEWVHLKALGLNPRISSRDRLGALVRHFGAGRGVWAVSEGSTGTVHVSRGLAIKVRDLVKAGQLDWVLMSGASQQEPFSLGRAETVPDPALTPYRQRHWDDLLRLLTQTKAAAVVPFPLSLLGDPLIVPPHITNDPPLFRIAAEPLYPALRAHLGAEDPLWQGLEAAHEAMREYQQAVLNLSAQTLEALTVSVPGLGSAEKLVAGAALIADFFSLATTGAGLGYSFGAVPFDRDGATRWALELGGWRIGDAESPNGLDGLRVSLVSCQSVVNTDTECGAFVASLHRLQLACREMADALRDEPSLMARVLHGHCSLCS